MKKILITGGTGFIGRNLYEQLSSKYNIYCPTRQDLDLLDTEKVEAYLDAERFDVIVHTANFGRKGDAIPDDYLVLKNGLRMFFNLERCRSNYGKLIYFGSGAEYSSSDYIPFMKEEYFGKNIPSDAYGFYKYTLSKYTENQDGIYDLRLFGVVGKYEELYRFVSNNICRALKGLPIYINKHCFFDYISVDDVISVVEWFIENQPKYNHYNVCRGEHIDLYELAEIIKEELTYGENIVVKEPGWKREYSGDNSRLIREMGEIRFTPYRQIVRELITYYSSLIDTIDETVL